MYSFTNKKKYLVNMHICYTVIVYDDERCKMYLYILIIKNIMMSACEQ